MFSHLQVHTHYSLLEGIGTPKAYVEKAVELGMKTLAMTDYNGLYGAIEFYKLCKSNNIHPIIGVELHVVHDITVSGLGGGTVVLLAENIQGYQDLLELVSHANMKGFDQKPRIDFGLLQQYGKDLVCIVGGTNSLLGELVMQNESESKLQETVGLLRTVCGENSVYASLHTHDESRFEDVAKVNKAIKYMAEGISLPIILTNDVHYVNPEDQKPFEVALSIRDGKRIYDEDRRIVTIPLHMTSEDEVINTMKANGYEQSFIDSCFATIDAIVEKCQCEIELNKLLFPKYKAPDHIKELYEKNKDSLLSD